MRGEGAKSVPALRSSRRGPCPRRGGVQHSSASQLLPGFIEGVVSRCSLEVYPPPPDGTTGGPDLLHLLGEFRTDPGGVPGIWDPPEFQVNFFPVLCTEQGGESRPLLPVCPDIKPSPPPKGLVLIPIQLPKGGRRRRLGRFFLPHNSQFLGHFSLFGFLIPSSAPCRALFHSKNPN